MAEPDTSRDSVRPTTSAEHLSPAKAKKVVIRGIIPATGEYVNISATDNGDGTFSLKTEATAVLAKDTLPVAGITEAVSVAIVDGSGNQITTFGGGVQYTEDDIDISITGNAILGEGPSNTLKVFSAVTNGDAFSVHGPVIFGSDYAGGGFYPLTVDLNGNLTVVGRREHDATDNGSAPVKVGGYAKAAAPTDVSADGDIVNAWFLRNGAQAVNLTAAGALIAGDASNGLDVDVTRLPALPAGNNNIGDIDVASIAAGTNAIGGITGAGSNAQIKDDAFYAEDVTSGILMVHSRLWDGSAYDRQPGNSTDGMLVNLGTNNDVVINSGASASYDHGSNLDVDTAAEQLPSQGANFGVIVKAAITNTGIIYVGKSDVTAGTTDATDGFPLSAGESVTLPVNNANLLYVIGSALNQKIFWIAV